MARRQRESPIELANIHYYQGGYDFDFVDGLNRKYECPICLLCIRDPYQTSCGHRFCHSCIITWLGEGKTCPDDNCSLGEGDIFPDTIANREILQLIVRCPSRELGCQAVYRLADAEAHAANCKVVCRQNPASDVTPACVETSTCPDCGELVSSTAGGAAAGGTAGGGNQLLQTQSAHTNIVCPKVEVACQFLMVGCTTKVPRSRRKEHLQSQVGHHMQLLADKLTKLSQLQQAAAAVSGCPEQQLVGEGDDSCSLPPTSPTGFSREEDIRLSGSNLHNNSRLIRDLYQRIVQLEQRNCQQQIKIEQLDAQLAKSRIDGHDDKECGGGRFCQGEFVWRIKDFSSHHNKMRSCQGFVLYSKGFYSSPFGYKMCLRSNIYIGRGEEQLGVFFHVMQGENDDCLTWPFVGSVTITIFNQREGILREHFTESMDTLPGLAAFDRPSSHRNNRGFGFQEFIRLNGLYSGGFIKDDTLIIKATVKCKSE